MTTPIRVAILTISDRCARGDAEDESGPALARRAHEALCATIVHHACVPDEHDAITSTLTGWSDPHSGISLVLTTGGTGFSPRDSTPEAASQVIDRPALGLVHLMLSVGIEKTPFAALSRAVAGIRNSTLIITLPGSPRGCIESFDAIASVLPHAVDLLRGEGDDHPASE